MEQVRNRGAINNDEEQQECTMTKMDVTVNYCPPDVKCHANNHILCNNLCIAWLIVFLGDFPDEESNESFEYFGVVDVDSNEESDAYDEMNEQ
jgi:hypothetical protein